MNGVFNDEALRGRVSGLASDWLNQTGRRPLEVVRAIYGPHVDVTGYRYAGPIRAYVASCLSTHRVFLLDTTGWDNTQPGASSRRGLLSEAVVRYDEAASLLALANVFAEHGYPQRREAQNETPGDRFAVALAKRWFESRLDVGDEWTVTSATVLAVMQGADLMEPYLPEALHLASSPT